MILDVLTGAAGLTTVHVLSAKGIVLTVHGAVNRLYPIFSESKALSHKWTFPLKKQTKYNNMEDSKNVIAFLYDIFLKNSLEDGSVDEKKQKDFDKHYNHYL